jgi:hypothetical protein
LRRPTQVEQENNTGMAENIAMKYQLTVKDFNIGVRDNRIRAKDERIAELENDAEMARTNYMPQSITKKQIEPMLRAGVFTHSPDNSSKIPTMQTPTTHETAISYGHTSKPHQGPYD